MSAIHYSQMLCQLSYGEAIASCLLALETLTGLRIKYELTNDVITPPSTHPIDPVLPHPFTARTPGPTSARRPARKARRAVAQAPRQSPPIAAPAAARVRGRRAQIRRCPAPHCCRPPAVAVAVPPLRAGLQCLQYPQRKMCPWLQASVPISAQQVGSLRKEVCDRAYGKPQRLI